jgi:hypothetical protein
MAGYLSIYLIYRPDPRSQTATMHILKNLKPAEGDQDRSQIHSYQSALHCCSEQIEMAMHAWEDDHHEWQGAKKMRDLLGARMHAVGVQVLG